MMEMKTFPYKTFKEADEEMSDGIEPSPSILIDEGLSDGINEDPSPAVVIDEEMSEGIEPGPSILIDEELSEGINEDPSPAVVIDAQEEIPEVVYIASATDNPSLHDITIRMAILGTISILTSAPFKAQELFLENIFEMETVLIQMTLALPAGHLMAAILPTRLFTIPRTGWAFSLNPGPFGLKEHALIGVCAIIGKMRPMLIQSVATYKNYFGAEVFWPTAYMLILSSYFVCFLFVGMFPNLVSSPRMWWPTELLEVVFLRTLHEENSGSLLNMSKRKFFFVVFFVSFILQMIPSFVFPSLSGLSSLCWIWKNSVTAHQIGSGLFGLGILSFSLDWSSITKFTSDPLATPRVVILNVMVGYFIVMFLVTPLLHWSNWFDTQNIPMLSTDLFDKYGNIYDIDKVLNSDGVTFNETAFRDYSPVRMSAFMRASYAQMFASVFISAVHIVLKWENYKNVREDIHNRLMERYNKIPRSWFFATSGFAFVLVIICKLSGFGPQTSFPFLAVLAALVSVVVVVFQLAIILATTGQMIPISLAFGLIGGILFPNKPFQYMIYRDYAYQTATNTIHFMGFLKLGQYLKIAPKAMYNVLIAASFLSCTLSFHEAWFQINKAENNCAQHGSTAGSNNTCSSLDMFHNTSNMWSIIGSRRILSEGNYGRFVLVFIIVSTVVEVLSSIFSRRWKFLNAINTPIILAAPQGFPATTASNFNSWLIAGLGCYVLAPRYIPGWSPEWQFLLSVALAAGTGLASGMISPLLSKVVQMPDWWGSPLQDHCPLAKCPTSFVAGCPDVGL